MKYIDRTFTDESITLDGNSYVRCTFDGCVLWYNGGTVEIIGGMKWLNGGNIRFGTGVDPVHNAVSQFIRQNASASGFRPATDDEIASNEAVTPKKDLS
ncbi:hypothetical protein [Sphingomonas sp. Leaf30]|uniref:hypothetical protein n=1 Tax=Sphingomonas sp. Leaf30 TaxID=1736213 RepID=UPI0007019183|nr:hypothetical protein [Sphingomonas sp. Leaf30]KQN11567.1 hypothetical protein ASE89_14375 [Sphingomonas sp. Leaf30]